MLWLGSLLSVLVPRGVSSWLGIDSARAGAPMPCGGYETTACQDGRLQTRCCPAGAKCNYRDEPFIGCGHGLCTTGGDPGRCLAPRPNVTAAKSEADCKTESGDWALVCADKVVVSACLPPMPTNFMGPGFNPRFVACGSGASLSSTGDGQVGDRCTTHLLEEDCYPTREELGLRACQGALTKVCLGGKVIEKCLPQNLSPFKPRVWPASTFVTCDDGSCAVGSDKSKGCRN